MQTFCPLEILIDEFKVSRGCHQLKNDHCELTAKFLWGIEDMGAGQRGYFCLSQKVVVIRKWLCKANILLDYMEDLEERREIGN